MSDDFGFDSGFDSAANALASETSEFQLRAWLKKYEALYFPHVTPAIEKVQIVPPNGTGNASCFLPAQNIIQVHPQIAPFTKSCRILLLHELIHSALFKRDKDADAEEGERFEAECKRLQAAGAYDDLY